MALFGYSKHDLLAAEAHGAQTALQTLLAKLAEQGYPWRATWLPPTDATLLAMGVGQMLADCHSELKRTQEWSERTLADLRASQEAQQIQALEAKMTEALRRRWLSEAAARKAQAQLTADCEARCAGLQQTIDQQAHQLAALKKELADQAKLIVRLEHRPQQ